MNQADRDRLVTLKKAKKKLITQREAAEECSGPKSWTEKRPFLRWWAALKMKERQCPEPARVTRPA